MLLDYGQSFSWGTTGFLHSEQCGHQNVM